MKRSYLRSKSPAKRFKRASPTKGYKPPQWFSEIKPGGHGNTPAQKRLWRIVSEYVRERDFKLYGKCVSCDHRFTHWKQGHAGHYLPYSICHSWYKFDPENIALQCEACNMGLMRSGAHIGHEMGEELKRRHGPGILEQIARDNLSYRGQKMEVWQIVAKVEEIVRLSTPLVKDV
jgi:hypothetical protein